MTVLADKRELHIYAEFRARGRDVVVARSRQPLPHVWLFLEGTAAFDLNEEQAATLRDALSAFLEEGR